MYKILFESQWLIIEQTKEKDYYYISFTIAHFIFGFHLNPNSLSLLPYMVLNTNLIKTNSWSPPSLDIGFLFIYIGIIYNYKNNLIKQYFEDKEINKIL